MPHSQTHTEHSTCTLGGWHAPSGQLPGVGTMHSGLTRLDKWHPRDLFPACSATAVSRTALRLAQALPEHSSRTLPSSDKTGGTWPGPSTPGGTPPARSPTAASLTAHGLGTGTPIRPASFLQKQLAPTKAARGAALLVARPALPKPGERRLRLHAQTCGRCWSFRLSRVPCGWAGLHAEYGAWPPTPSPTTQRPSFPSRLVAARCRQRPAV